MKIDKTVKKESLYVGAWVIALSAAEQAVFLIIGRWDYTVLTGAMLSGCAAWLNFFLLGLTVQAAVALDEKKSHEKISLSHTLRLFGEAAVLAVGIAAPCFNPVSTVLGMLFPRVALVFRGISVKKEEKDTN